MAIECPKADGSSPKTQKFSGRPPMCIDPTKRYSAEMVTSEGTIHIELNALAGDPEIPRLTKLSPGLDSVTVITTVSPAPGSEGSAERLIGLMISRGGIPVNVPGYKLLRKQIAVAG